MTEPQLHVIDHQGRRALPIDKSLFTIGRRVDADLRLDRPDVSRDHAEIVRDGDHYVLRDRNSTYGTFVNDERIVERLLANGDRLRFGLNADIRVVIHSDAATLSTLREATSQGTDFQQVASVMAVLRALGAGRIVSEILSLVVDAALDVTNAERGFVMLANDRGGLDFCIARGRGGVTLPGATFATSTRIPRDVFRTGRSYVVDDLKQSDDADDHYPTLQLGIRNVMCVPLQVTPPSTGPDRRVARKIGVLYLDSQQPRGRLSSTRLASLEAFAIQAAIAIESARLYSEAAEKAKIDRDLRLAAEIQRSLLAQPLAATTVCDLAAATFPCRTVGGDFYDYLPLPDDSFAFALADVAGKGPPAALLAGVVQSHWVAHAAALVEPAAVMTAMNTALLRRPVEARFATMFYGVLRTDGLLTYCNAAQEPPLVVTRDTTRTLEVGSPVIGILENVVYRSGTFQLRDDDVVIVCSDGVTEATDAGDREFGRDRVIDVVSGSHGAAPETVLNALLEAVRTFSAGSPQADDVTALALRYRHR